MLRRDAPNIEELRLKDREKYQRNRKHILQRLKKRRDEKIKNAKKSTKGKLIEHHIKYKEIHGVDETVWIPQGEHIQRHHRLRLEGKCNISPKELERISARAKCRTDKYRARRRTIQFADTVMEHVQLVEEICYDVGSGHVSARVRFRANNKLQLLNINI